MSQSRRRPEAQPQGQPAVVDDDDDQQTGDTAAGTGDAGPETTPPETAPAQAIAYVAGENLVYVRTATSGRHGLPVHPGDDVPADALPAHVETLEDLGLVKRKP